MKESGVLARDAPIGASDPMRGLELEDFPQLCDSHPAPEGLLDGRGRDLYLAGEPAFLAGAAMDVGAAFEQLWQSLAEQDVGWPLITLCSRGNRYAPMGAEPRRHQPPYLVVDRLFDCTFANDPAQQQRHSGPGQYAHRGCTGQCGPIQEGISVYAAFRSMVADVRGRLAQDLIGPMLSWGPRNAEPVPVTYAYVCRSGRHRSVAAVELLAHCLLTCGVANVKVVHEDLDLGYHGGHFGSCGCPDPDRCRNLRGLSEDKRRQHHIYYNQGLQAARANARRAWATWGA